MAQSQYASPTDIQVSSLTPAAAARFGTAAINASLQAASSIADSYIVSQFDLPLQVFDSSAVPPKDQGWDMSLTLGVCNIAAYLLYTQFGFNPGAPADQLIEERYKRAISWLEQIRDKLIFPQWIDANGTAEMTPDQSGDYVISDPIIGFTPRGATHIAGDLSNPFGPFDE